MKISSRGHRHLIYIVKRNTKIDGMGPFNRQTDTTENNIFFEWCNVNNKFFWLGFSRKTVLCRMDMGLYGSELSYQPGDHLAIMAANREELVDNILSRLYNAPPADELVKLEVFSEKVLGKNCFFK